MFAHVYYTSLTVSLTVALSITGCAKNNNSQDIESITAVESSTSDTTENTEPEYANMLFDQSYVHTIDVDISDEDWADLLANPTNKTKYQVNITIDGETFEKVSFATKGNTSLSSVAHDEESDRYSFKVNFGKYQDGQTYYGLDKLNLNNIYADATYMKDYLSYEIFRAAGVDAPLTSYVQVSINGEVLGLYLAIEDIGDSYLDRTQNGEGSLYKPETEMLANMGGGMGGPGKMPDGMEPPEGFEIPEGMEPPEGFEVPEGMTRPDMPDDKTNENTKGDKNTEDANTKDSNIVESSKEQSNTTAKSDDQQQGGNGMSGSDQQGDVKMPDGFKGGGMDMGDSSNGASLAYTDDELDSYSDIFDNAETDVTDEDKQAVITALKNLSEGKIEEAVDVTEVIKYFVAHNFVMNYDSYTGTMLHNYYLYENNGLLSMLPWDYNLAFGAFMNNGRGMEGEMTATDIVNYGIDTPLSGTTEDNRPMWSWIVNNEEYLKQYHEEYETFISSYFESGKFKTEMERVYEMIRPYVESDPSAFYTLDEFDKAYNTLLAFCNYRAESIRLQLDGKLSTVTDEQEETARVDVSDITINDMGRQNMGFDGDKDFKMKGGFKIENSSTEGGNTDSNNDEDMSNDKK